MKKSQKTPHKDRLGNTIYEGCTVRSWRTEYDPYVESGYWLYEIVKYYKGDWYLFQKGLDYDKLDDEPYLLAELYHEVEIVED
ncbi:MAG: hypothetical protein R2780_01680 [Crocinitomicaceae bacterium]